MTVRTRAQIKSDADTHIEDNTGGNITPADVRQRIKDLADSAVFPEDLGGALFNVKDYGAVGDGVADDIAAFEAAIGSVPAAGGAIYIPAGTYILGEGSTANVALLVDRSAIRFFGDGTGQTILKLADAADSHVFQIEADIEGIAIEHMSIDGNAAEQTLNVHGILFRGPIDLRLADLEVHHTAAYGIGGQNGANRKITIDRVWTHDTGFNGIDIKNKSNGNESILISNIIAERWGLNTAESSKAGVTVRGRANISNVTCRDFGGASTSAEAGVRLRDGETADTNGFGGHYSVVTNVTIEGNSKVATLGVQCLARNCAISGVSASGVAIGVQVAQSNNVLSSLAVDDCDVGLDFDTGSLATGPDDNIVNGLTATDCGISVRDAGKRNTVLGINSKGATTAIDIQSTAEDATFIGGDVTGNTSPLSDTGLRTKLRGIRGVRSEPTHPGLRSSPTTYYYPATKLPSATAGAISANVFYALPINVPGAVVDRIGVEVTAGSAGNARLGIYANDNGVPGALIIDSGDLDTTSIAILEGTIAATVLPDDWVWLVALFSATPTVRTGTSGNGSVLGAALPSAASHALLANRSYGALPSSAPAMTAFGGGTTPILWLRKS